MARTIKNVLEEMEYNIRRYFDILKENRGEKQADDAECVLDDIKELAEELITGEKS